MNATIKYYTKNVYGNDLMYIVDPVQQTAIELVSGRKTITKMDIYALNMIGFDFVEVVAPKAKALKEGK